MIYQCVFFKNVFNSIFVPTYMRCRVSCQKMCVQNQVWVQLLVVVINGILGSGSNHPVVLNTINSWSYMSLVWLGHISGIVLHGITLLVSRSRYLSFSEWGWLAWSRNSIYNTRNITDNSFLHSFPNISISIPWSAIMLTLFVNKNIFILTELESIRIKYLHYWPKFKRTISNNMWPHVFISLFGLYVTCSLVAYLAYILFFLVCDNFTFTSKMLRCWNPL